MDRHTRIGQGDLRLLRFLDDVVAPRTGGADLDLRVGFRFPVTEELGDGLPQLVPVNRAGHGEDCAVGPIVRLVEGAQVIG